MWPCNGKIKPKIYNYNIWAANDISSFYGERIVKKKKILIEIINFPSLNYFNKYWLKKILNNKNKIFILDEHFKTGGFSDIFLSFVNDNNLNKNKTFKKIALDDFPSCGQPEEVLKKHNLDPQSLYNKIYSFIKND